MTGSTNKPLRVTVIDMQPITPAIGGGRQRLLGLYHALGSNIECTYVGSYDWPGEASRDQRLTPGLREIVVPLSSEHHRAAETLSKQTGGRTVIDLAFADQVHLSPNYLAVARKHAMDADIVVFSHPWAYPAIRDVLRTDQLVVYDSQNVEGLLRMSLHADLPEADRLIRRVVEQEYRLCRDADLVLTCSQNDRDLFARVYETGWDRLRVVPNGIFAYRDELPTPAQRAAAKQSLGVKQARVALFVGSNYGPNNAAATFVADSLAGALPDVAFAIVGGCGDCLTNRKLAANVIVTGTLDEVGKRVWMRAADAAVNPLSEGSGTSIKMFDFMAAALPTITTTIGARGISSNGLPPFVVAELDHFATALAALLGNERELVEFAKRGRQTVEDFYAWERISPALGRQLTLRYAGKERPRAFFTVVIPTYERHQQLDQLMLKLDAQSERDFEVIVVDQSSTPWPAAYASRRFPLCYVHSEIKGAVSARNLGGGLATGQVIAFTDDDCQPTVDWLKNARVWFKNPGVVGVEGIIRSNHADEPEWRQVSNVGFAGIGFMTANLLVRNVAFQQLDGFDPTFDKPHFREDTDFGWRLQTLGEVPYAEDVEVFHPAQPRDTERESQAERNRFFEKDALLCKKHPKKYKQLFLMEAHYKHTPGFWENMKRGMELYGVELPEWMKSLRQ